MDKDNTCRKCVVSRLLIKLFRNWKHVMLLVCSNLPEFFSSSFELVGNSAFGGDSFHRNDLLRYGLAASEIKKIYIL